MAPGCNPDGGLQARTEDRAGPPAAVAWLTGGAPALKLPACTPLTATIAWWSSTRWRGLWANLKGHELANRCCADRAELIATTQVGLIRARRDPDLLHSFLAGAGLTL